MVLPHNSVVSNQIVKWTLPITVLVTVIGFWWHNRMKNKPTEDEEEEQDVSTCKEKQKNRSQKKTTSNGCVIQNGNVKKVKQDLNEFISTVKRMNGTLDHPVVANGIKTTPTKQSLPKPCTPQNTPSPKDIVVAQSVKHLESSEALSYLENRQFGVEKLEKSPQKKNRSSLHSQVSSSTTDNELQFEIEHLDCQQNQSKRSAVDTKDDCDSTIDLTHDQNSSLSDVSAVIEEHNSSGSPCKYNTKSYSESAANAEVDEIIKKKTRDTSKSAMQQRDSANHSPNPDTINSPSLSDVHSEGSSDSGKGCSEASRTPAGGSSVSGEVQWCSYEFVIPQHMVGKLIGKGGAFIHRVRSQTNTKMYIKRHPNSYKLKICCIEGTQPDIDTALGMIRQKFPLSDYPFLTMEKVTFLSSNALSCPLRPEPFQLQLVEGINNDVCISSLVSAGRFFVQLPSHPSFQGLESLNLLMNTTYNSAQAPLLPAPVENALVAAPAMGGWFRAQILTVDVVNLTCTIKFVDYGGFMTVETPSLRQIRADFLSLPFQAIECALANVIPSNGSLEWTDEARTLVHGLTSGHVLQAQVYDYSPCDQLPLIYLYTLRDTEVVLVNQELVERGYAALDQAATGAVATNGCATVEELNSVSTEEEHPVSESTLPTATTNTTALST